MIVTLEEQQRLLDEFAKRTNATTRMEKSFAEGMAAAFKLMDKKLKK